jgi:NADH-quinone oxidoreductase subunit C
MQNSNNVMPDAVPAPASGSAAAAKLAPPSPNKPAGAAPVTPAAPAPPPAPLPNPLPELGLPFEGVDHSAKGYCANLTIAPDQVLATAECLDKAGFSLDTITGVDWMAESKMEVIYDFFHAARLMRVAVRTRVPRDRPEVPTISGVFPGANWHERETHDFFGIHFSGHPNLTPFLLPEDADYHPLRKDFVA